MNEIVKYGLYILYEMIKLSKKNPGVIPLPFVITENEPRLIKFAYKMKDPDESYDSLKAKNWNVKKVYLFYMDKKRNIPTYEIISQSIVPLLYDHYGK